MSVKQATQLTSAGRGQLVFLGKSPAERGKLRRIHHKSVVLSQLRIHERSPPRTLGHNGD